MKRQMAITATRAPASRGTKLLPSNGISWIPRLTASVEGSPHRTIACARVSIPSRQYIFSGSPRCSASQARSLAAFPHSQLHALPSSATFVPSPTLVHAARCPRDEVRAGRRRR
ncbi:hypothetical protein PUN28_017187 [Cardiocondyla obscurior]|uniref:Uncharacterized protein n=1 Tax=Cardiocondyla obscurior TaxID=286306 RepID=A0AAW2EPE5_9HYME